jgi:hypothetical protein
MFKLTSRKASPKADEPGEPKPAKSKAERKSAKAKAERKPAKVKAVAAPAEPQVYRKPAADVYTVLLSIALIALAIATTSLWMVMRGYDYTIKGGPSPTWNRPAAPAGLDAAPGDHGGPALA